MFAEHVKLFEFAGIPMIGNASRGDIIGLSDDGLRICQGLSDGTLDIAYAREANPELIAHMESGGFFDPQTPDFKIDFAYVHVTQRCNLKCVGCYSDCDKRNSIPDPTMDQLSIIFDKLRNMGVTKINISGGEPMLRNDLVDVLKMAKLDHRFEAVNLLTNGTVFNQEMIEQIAPYVASISVSFDGASADDVAHIRGKQRFDDLVKFVQAVKSAGIDVCITPTLHRMNYKDIDKYETLANRLDADCSFSILTGCSDDSDNGNALMIDNDCTDECNAIISHTLGNSNFDDPLTVLESLKCKATCGVCSKLISVDSDGTVYPCHMSHSDELAIGCLLDPDFDAETIRGFIENKCTMVDEIEQCVDCKFKYLCGGACHLTNLFNDSHSDKQHHCVLSNIYFTQLEEMLKCKLIERG